MIIIGSHKLRILPDVSIAAGISILVNIRVAHGRKQIPGCTSDFFIRSIPPEDTVLYGEFCPSRLLGVDRPSGGTGPHEDISGKCAVGDG
jgi:hypothetical protein